MNSIYLDNNATTRIHPDVAAAMAACYAAGYVNPASQHRLGQAARHVLEEAREGIGRILGAHIGTVHADQIIFTSGGTEANNLALGGLGAGVAGRVIISTIEHPSVFEAANHLERQGTKVVRVPVGSNGVLNFDVLRETLETGATRLVSVMFGNNETGVLQPIHEIAQHCQAQNVLFHTDAVQTIGKVPVQFRELGVSALTIAAHKFHGPVGIGALILRPDIKLDPLHHGGFQQFGIRPGTESVALAVGMHKALAIWSDEMLERTQRVEQLRNSFETTLVENLPWIVINGHESPRLPNTSNISFLGLDRQSLLIALDLAGVACSTGSACASGSSEPSPVLTAMGLSGERISSALRFSLSAFTTAWEIDEATRRIIQVCQNLQHRAAARKSPSPARQ